MSHCILVFKPLQWIAWMAVCHFSNKNTILTICDKTVLAIWQNGGYKKISDIIFAEWHIFIVSNLWPGWIQPRSQALELLMEVMGSSNDNYFRISNAQLDGWQRGRPMIRPPPPITKKLDTVVSAKGPTLTRKKNQHYIYDNILSNSIY
jgi:hypothetical protein